jgi:OCT family organic cation transporter-like MFS transporter 4/5
MCGGLSLGYNNIIAVFTTELTHGKWRLILGGLLCECFWNVGFMSLGLLVYVVRNMQTLEMVIALSATPFLLLWYFMPESPRWLLAEGKKEKVSIYCLSIDPVLKRCKMGVREKNIILKHTTYFRLVKF